MARCGCSEGVARCGCSYVGRVWQDVDVLRVWQDVDLGRVWQDVDVDRVWQDVDVGRTLARMGCTSSRITRHPGGLVMEVHAPLTVVTSSVVLALT